MKNVKMTGKILFTFGIMLVMALLIGFAGLAGVNKMETVADIYAETTIPAIDNLWTARRSVQAVEKRALETTIVMTSAELSEVESGLIAERESIDTALAEFVKLAPQYQSQVDAINADLNTAATIRQQIMTEAWKFTEEGNARAYDIYHDSFVPTYEKVITGLQELHDEVDAAVQVRHENAKAAKKAAMIMILIVILIMFAVIAVFVKALTNSITRPIKKVERVMKKLVDGDLQDIEIKHQSGDEIGMMADSVRGLVDMMQKMVPDIVRLGHDLGDGNFNTATEYREIYVGEYEEILKGMRYIRDTMDATVEQIDNTSEQLMSGANQVASGAQALSQGATEQASSVEELAAAISELEGKVKLNAENANYASGITTEAMAGIEESNTHMNSLMQAMNDIETSSNEINRIIKTIDDIAFQTNILALNAAVEAARAGAAGKGFAVVADEVRNLAQKSAEAAKNTTTLIENSMNAVQAGIANANDTAHALQAVVEKAEGVAVKVQEISQATEEQADRITQISVGIDQISAVTQTISATSEESAAASEELASQANILKEMTGKFIRYQGDGRVGAPKKDYTPVKPAKPAIRPASIPSFPADNYMEPICSEFVGGDDKY